MPWLLVHYCNNLQTLKRIQKNLAINAEISYNESHESLLERVVQLPGKVLKGGKPYKSHEIHAIAVASPCCVTHVPL